MRGQIVKKGNSFYVVLSMGLDAKTGKYPQKWIPAGKTRREAESKRADIITQMDKGIYVTPQKMTLAEYLEMWVRDYCVPNLTPKTTETYQTLIRVHIVPSLGQITLTGLKPEHLAKFYSEKLKTGRFDGKGGLSNRTVRYLHVTLHKALSNALKLGKIARNPADAVDPPKLHRREMAVMNDTEINRFLDAARSTPFYRLFYVLLHTGLRRSEVCALKWSDIDLLLCQFSVKRTLNQLHKGVLVFGEPKTKKSRRLVPLSPSTVGVLSEHREAQEMIFKSLGKTLSEDDLVFCHEDGTPLFPDTITQAFSDLAKKLNLKGIHTHSARHSFASLLLENNVHPKIVSDLLGHSSISITLDTYSHVSPGLLQATANRLDELLKVKREKVVVENNL